MNVYSGIISSAFKQIFRDAISALLYNDALTIPCTINYGITRYETCTNCLGSTIGRKPNNSYLTGGPMPFQAGSTCPMCNGTYKRPIETTEDIHLMVIWDFKKFMGGVPVNMQYGDLVQTMTFLNNTTKLKMAKELIVATNLNGIMKHRFSRDTEPQPCGFGDNDFVFCNWKRSG